MQSCCQRLVVMEDASLKMSWQPLTANKTSCLLKSVWRRAAESRRKFLSVLSAPGTLCSVGSCQFRNNGEKLELVKAWGTSSAMRGGGRGWFGREVEGRHHLFCWVKGDTECLRAACDLLKGQFTRAKLLSLMPDSIERVNKHELQLRRFRLGIRKHSLSRRVVQPWAHCQESLYPPVFTGFSCPKPWLS